MTLSLNQNILAAPQAGVPIATPGGTITPTWFNLINGIYNRVGSSNRMGIVADATTLTGTTLAANVTYSSLTSVGTITSGNWAGAIIPSIHGGTGYGTYTDGQVLIGSTASNALI